MNLDASIEELKTWCKHQCEVPGDCQYHTQVAISQKEFYCQSGRTIFPERSCKGSGVLNTVLKALNKHPLQILQPKVDDE